MNKVTRFITASFTITILFSCSKGSIYNFDDHNNISEPEAGNYYHKTELMVIRDVEYVVDTGFLANNETMSKPDSNLIKLPMVRIHSLSDTPENPIFLLAGGPGNSNIWEYPPTWLLEDHDIVMVGFRGVDGSVSFRAPEVSKALKQANVYSDESISNLGTAYFSAFSRLKESGVDMDSYTMEEVIYDFEIARKVFGYDKINLYSASYGTRLAYLYGITHPESINRSFMYSANPPGGFIYDGEVLDDMLEKYGDWWNQNPELKKRTPDLTNTIKSVLSDMPKRWLLFSIDSDKVRFLTHALLMNTDMAAMVFDAYVSASEGDSSGLALMTLMYDLMIPNTTNWGDNISKVVSSDYDPGYNYKKTKESIIGSPFSEFIESMKYSGWPSRMISEHLRKPQISHVETLILQGELDFSTPLVNVQNNLIPYLTNGKLIVLPYHGHTGDLIRNRNAFRPLVAAFFKEGKTDGSAFDISPRMFVLEQSPAKMAKQYLLYAVLAVLVFIALILLIIYVLRKKRRGNRPDVVKLQHGI